MQKKNYEDVFQLISGLDTRNHDDSLLSLLWKYKGKMDSFTLTCLESLSELLSKDPVIADYFSELPAPSYKLTRYTDWIRPYLEKQLKTASDQALVGKQETIAKVLSLFEEYERFVEEE